jgi:hypothetical protein
MTWNSETLAQNPNANAIRWGTMYNFRFDSNSPPQTTNATIGFLKTGSPITVQVQGPSTAPAASVSVSGRVSNTAGVGLARAGVSLTSSSGIVITARTSSFGFYFFDDVPVGTYTVNVNARRYTFNSQVVQISENTTSLNFSPAP